MESNGEEQVNQKRSCEADLSCLLARWMAQGQRISVDPLGECLQEECGLMRGRQGQISLPGDERGRKGVVPRDMMLPVVHVGLKPLQQHHHHQHEYLSLEP